MPRQGHYAKSLIGERFGRLVVIERTENYVTKTGTEAVWVCKCDCGKIRSVRAGQLRSGHTKSCGCLSADMARAANTKHGSSSTKLYGVWSSMKGRCENPTDRGYPNYGGRGITVCDEWHDFNVFKEWAESNGYREGSRLSIDRINVDKGYSPENCRWANDKTQANNTRRNAYYEYRGERLTMTQLAEKYGISVKRLGYRLRHGWNIDDAINLPKQK